MMGEWCSGFFRIANHNRPCPLRSSTFDPLLKTLKRRALDPFCDIVALPTYAGGGQNYRD
jgi:hypothetical protein